MAKAKTLDKDIRIVIAPFGWVFVGVYSLEYRLVGNPNGIAVMGIKSPEGIAVDKVNAVAGKALEGVGYSIAVKLTNASVIRKWGTTQGLGQLITGPVKDTVLDPCGVVEIHEQTAVATIKCVSGWEL